MLRISGADGSVFAFLASNGGRLGVVGIHPGAYDAWQQGVAAEATPRQKEAELRSRGYSKSQARAFLAQKAPVAPPEPAEPDLSGLLDVLRSPAPASKVFVGRMYL